MIKLDTKNYIDETEKYLKNANPNNHLVKEQLYFDYQGSRYYVDGKNVVLDYSKKELEIAIWLAKTFGGKIYILPRVNNPSNIKTADYIWQNEYWDLKEIKENAKSKSRAIDNILKVAKKQANNFILDITKCNLNKDNVIEQVKKIYITKNREWINKIIIFDSNKLIKVYKRKKEVDTLSKK